MLSCIFPLEQHVSSSFFITGITHSIIFTSNSYPFSLTDIVEQANLKYSHSENPEESLLSTIRFAIQNKLSLQGDLDT